MIRSKLLLVVIFGALLAFVAGTSVASAQDDAPYGGGGTTTTTTGGGGGGSTTTGGGGGGGGSTTTGGGGGGGGGSTTTPTAPITVVRGDTIDVSGTGCAPGAPVVVTYDDGTNLGTFTADSSGNFTTTITIPTNSSLGTHTATATCGDVQQFISLNVLDEAANSPGGPGPGVNNGTLPRTGSSNTGPLVGIGAAAIVLGAAFVYGARRPGTARQ